MLRLLRERRLCASGILLDCSSKERREEPEDEGVRSEGRGLVVVEEEVRDAFFASLV